MCGRGEDDVAVVLLYVGRRLQMGGGHLLPKNGRAD